MWPNRAFNVGRFTAPLVNIQQISIWIEKEFVKVGSFT